ncbi:MAG: PilZ domain-containing protein [Nitrosomonas ureae]
MREKPMKETGSDKRGYSRIPSKFTVTATKLEYPFTETAGVSATSRDVAEGGISFVSSHHYTPNTLVSLKIDLKGWRRHAKNVRAIVDDAMAKAPLTAVAEVVWAKELPGEEGYEIGVKFINIDQDDYNAFQKYLERIRSPDDQ